MKSGYTPKIFSGLFNQRKISPYNLRRYPEFSVPLTRAVYHESESISDLSSKISFKQVVKDGFYNHVSVDSVRTIFLTLKTSNL